MATPPPVGILAGPSVAFVTTLIAALKTGSAALPLSPEDPDERLATIAADAGCDPIVTERHHLERANAIAAAAPLRPRVVVLDDELEEHNPAVLDRAAVMAREPLGERQVPAAADAYVVYTSGTTGTPKGVPISHGNLIPLLRWQEERFGLGPELRVAQTLSPAFDFGLQEILTSVFFGATLFLPGRERLLDPAACVDFVVEREISMLYATPTYCEEIVAVGREMPSLRTVLLGGEMLPAATVRRLTELTGECAVFNGYGPTEATINCAMLRLADGRDARGGASGALAVGWPSGNSRVHVLDERLEPVPSGVLGEVCIGGDGVAAGYLNRPAATAASFLPDPFASAPGARLYRTGDVGRRTRSGAIELLGRRDEQVKLRGHRIELGEVAAALRAAPGVREAAVAVRESLPAGRGLVGYFVPDRPGHPRQGALRAELARRLPAYMVPTALVELGSLPRTANGKLDRATLPAPAPRPAPEPASLPRGETELLVGREICATLGLVQVGREESFFEVGGHSLLAAQLQSRLERALDGRRLPIAAVFANPTVASLARFLEAGEREASVEQSLRRRQSQPTRDRNRIARRAQRNPT